MDLSIRQAGTDDAPALLEIYAPYVLDTCISFEAAPPTLEQFQARMNSIVWLLAEVEGKVLGYAYASRHRERAAYAWSVEVSVYVDRDSRGGGVGRALYDALLEELKRSGYCHAYAGITLPNEASVKLHRRLGFEPVGVFKRVGFKMGRWHDVGWWQLCLRDTDDPGAPPAWSREGR